MSLKKFVNLKDVKAKFREVFAKPSPNLYGEMKANPLTQNYSLVGTAFDYLLRFYLQHLYPFAQGKYWIAEASILSPLFQDNLLVLHQVQEIIKTARETHQIYLKDGKITDDLLRSSILLAQIDPIFRRKVIVPNLGSINEDDVTDLRNLINLVIPKTFHAEKLCLLDPTFGPASSLVGGADVDLIVDDTIIDFKTTIDPKIQREHFDQVLGYYILYRIGSADGSPKNHHINKIGIYSARYGNLRVFPVHEIANETVFENFCNWFIERAQQEFGTNLKRLKTLYPSARSDS